MKKIKIGILSDTHGYFNKRLKSFFCDCEELWHAGDIGNIETFNEINNFKPLRAVYGNIDDYKVRTETSESLIFTINNKKIFLTHIGGYPGKYYAQIKETIEKENPDLFVCGHSHILKVIYDNKYNLLHVNPGAAGFIGIHKVSTAIRMDISEKGVSNLEIIEFPRKREN